MRDTTRLKIGIAGAGLLGRLLAFQLAREGHAVDVFEADAPAVRHAAGFTAAGMLSPYAELESGDATVFSLGQRSLELWPMLIEALPEPILFARAGSILAAHAQDAASATSLVNRINARVPGGSNFTPLDESQRVALEPDLRVAGPWWYFPEEGHVDAQAVMDVLLRACTEVDWHWEQPVAAIHDAGLIELQNGTQQAYDWVFDVRGMGGRPELQTLRGVRGEVIWLQAPEIRLHRPVRIMHPRYRLYLVPREDDRLLIGASEIESEDRSPISVRSALELLSAAYSINPALAEARIVHTETNLRPALPDNLPVLETAGVVTRINGLFRHGYLLAPALVEQALAGVGRPQLERTGT